MSNVAAYNMGDEKVQESDGCYYIFLGLNVQDELLLLKGFDGKFLSDAEARGKTMNGVLKAAIP